MNEAKLGLHSTATAEPGSASAEAGHVILDGPPGLAATLTPAAAELLARSLIAAADEARRQAATVSRGRGPI